ncbi:hypothetical protein MUB16_28440 [Priestia sp. OVL9]|nr:hypothetical protein [Priestia sp. OVL9]
MDMINIFNAPKNAFNDMLYVNGQEIYLNGKKKFALITNPEIKEFNDKYVSTDYQLMRGDYIYYNSMYWMIWNQVTVPRAKSFKGIMRQAEHDVVFNLFYTDVTSKYLLKVPAVIQRTSDYTLRTDEMMTLVDSEIHVFVKDTTSTRKINGLVGIPNGQIVIGEHNYDIVGVSYAKKGYLDITCRMGTRNPSTDYPNNIYWGEGKPADWADNYDLSFYEREGVSTLPIVPDNYQTSLTVSATSTAHSSETAGTVIATWTAEANKQTYANFNGYRILLLSDGNEVAGNIVNKDTLTATFGNLAIGSYIVEVYSIFGNNNTILPVSTTANVEDGNTSIVTPDTEITDVTLTSYDDTNSYGTLVWEKEKDASKFEGYTLTGYRVEVYTSSLWGGDTLRDYWVVSTEQCDIKTGWSGENGWFITVQSIFNNGVYMQPQRFEGYTLTGLPDTGGWSPW